MRNQPKISILIVSYNSEKYIAACLDSVLATSYKKKEVIIVDNGSSDNTPEILLKYKKKVRLFLLAKNLGYAEGNNFAATKAKGSLLLVLNPDTVVSSNFIQPLVERMLSTSDVAACQPAVYLLHDQTHLNLTGKVAHYLGFDWIRDYKKVTPPPAGILTSISGSCVLLNKELFKKTYLFDKDFFLYFEDSDLSWRARLLGYTLWFVPESTIYHDYTFVPDPSYLKLNTKVYFYERNRLAMILQNYSIKTIIFILPVLILMEIGTIIFAIQTGTIKGKLKSYIGLTGMIQNVMKKRERIQNIRIVGDKQILKDMAATITFEPFLSAAMKYIVNPWLWFYYKALIRFI